MKSFFRDVPGIGPMEIEHVFYEYEDPTLFVCVDMAENRYLCACCKLGEEWLVGKASENILVQMMDDKIPLDVVFSQKSDNAFALFWNGDHLKVHANIEQDMYPERGALLELSGDSDTLQYKEKLRKIILWKSALSKQIQTAPAHVPHLHGNMASNEYYGNLFKSLSQVNLESLTTVAPLLSSFDMQYVVKAATVPSYLVKKGKFVSTVSNLISSINMQSISSAAILISKLSMQSIAEASETVSLLGNYKNVLSYSCDITFKCTVSQPGNIATQKKESKPQQNRIIVGSLTISLAA